MAETYATVHRSMSLQARAIIVVPVPLRRSHVSGILALMQAANPGLLVTEIVDILRRTAVRRALPNGDVVQVPNAEAAIECAHHKGWTC